MSNLETNVVVAAKAYLAPASHLCSYFPGDLGYYDQDGRLFLCGRLKTMVKTLKGMVNPSEIEDCLRQHEAIKDVCVLGVPTPQMNEALTAVVVAKSGFASNKGLAEDLKIFVAGRMPAQKHLLGGVYFADALPTSSLGKVRIIALRELLGTLRRMDGTE